MIDGAAVCTQDASLRSLQARFAAPSSQAHMHGGVAVHGAAACHVSGGQPLDGSAPLPTRPGVQPAAPGVPPLLRPYEWHAPGSCPDTISGPQPPCEYTVEDPADSPTREDGFRLRPVPLPQRPLSTQHAAHKAYGSIHVISRTVQCSQSRVRVSDVFQVVDADGASRVAHAAQAEGPRPRQAASENQLRPRGSGDGTISLPRELPMRLGGVAPVSELAGVHSGVAQVPRMLHLDDSSSSESSPWLPSLLAAPLRREPGAAAQADQTSAGTPPPSSALLITLAALACSSRESLLPTTPPRPPAHLGVQASRTAQSGRYRKLRIAPHKAASLSLRMAKLATLAAATGLSQLGGKPACIQSMRTINLPI